MDEITAFYAGQSSDVAQSQPAPAEQTPDSLTEMTIGGVTFDLLPFTKGWPYVIGQAMIDYGVKEGADMDKETGLFIKKHWADIPLSIRQKFYFPFSKWRDARGDVVCLDDDGGKAHRYCLGIEDDRWYDRGRLLRRRVSSSV